MLIFTLGSLSAMIQVVCAILALRYLRWTRRRWGWSVVAAALIVQATRRVVGDLTTVGAPPHPPFWEVLGFLSSVLLLIGLVGMGRLFRQSDDDATFREATAARRTAEEALAVREAQFRTAFENSGIGTMLADLEGRVRRVNAAFCDMLGCTAADLIGLPSTDLMHPAEQRAELGEFRRLVEGSASSTNGELRCRHSRGHYLWVHVSRAVLRTADGAPAQVAYQFVDISARRRVEDLLRMRMSLMEYAASHSPADLMRAAIDAIEARTDSEIGFLHFVEPDQITLSLQVWSTKTTATYCHAVGQGMHYGLDAAGVWADALRERRPIVHNDYLALPHRKGLPPDHAPVLREVVVPVVRGDQVVALFGIGNKAEPYTDDDAVFTRHMADMSWDIIERRQAEETLREANRRLAEATARAQALAAQAEVANRAKGDFLARMSHEIRTPMNAIIGMAHLALRSDLTPRQTDYVEKIRSSAGALLGLINDILDFTRVESGRLTLERTEFTLRDLLARLADLTALRAQEKGLELVFAVAHDVPEVIVGDPLRLGQVLTNLTNNAIKFTEHGWIVVDVGVADAAEGQAVLRFQVRDTGIGVSQDQAARLFQVFSQGDESTTRRFGGSGLGLAICKSLVELMGGQIAVRSEAGAGSTFEFTVAVGTPRGAAGAPAVRLPGRTVLVVAGSAPVRESLVATLDACSCLVTTAESVAAAAASIDTAHERRQPYDLVLLDYTLPDASGGDAIRQVGERCAGRGTPVIVMPSLLDVDAARVQAADLGRGEILVKPVNPFVLVEALRRQFGGDGGDPSDRLEEPDRHVGRGGARSADGLGGLRVLLVEDNAINRQYVTELLEAAGASVATAHTGTEAVEAVAEVPFDLVLMDVEMPEMDGLEATRRIRERVGSDRLPILALSAHAMVDARERSLQAGMNDHITKPIEPDELMAALARWVPAAGGGRRAVPPQRRVPEEAAPPELPALCTVDTAEGVRRLGGNLELYERLIEAFCADYAGTASALVALLAEGRVSDAARVVHTIKGVAATLAAHRLQQAASDLEAALRSRTPSRIEVGLTLLVAAHEATMAELQAMVQARRGTPA